MGAVNSQLASNHALANAKADDANVSDRNHEDTKASSATVVIGPSGIASKTVESAPVPVTALDLQGKWCAGNQRMGLSDGQWTFLVGPVLTGKYEIDRIEATGVRIRVYWVDNKDVPMVTEFRNFSAIQNTIVQLRAKPRSSNSWSRFNHKFKRC